MTNTLLQIVDPKATGTVYFDLNDQTGANNAPYASSVQTRIIGDVDWGTPGWAPNRFQADITPGGLTVFNQAGLGTANMKVRIHGTSHDALMDAVNFLAGLLADGCTMKFSAAGSSVTRFVDIEPSSTPSLYSGRPIGLFEAARLYDTPDGIPLSLVRQPFFYDPELNPNVNLLSNGTMLVDPTNSGTPLGWTLVNGTAAISATEECVTLTYNGTGIVLRQDAPATAGLPYTASWEAILVSGDRIPQLRISTFPNTNALLQATNITATTWGTRVQAGGTIAATDTAARVFLQFNGGTNSTVVKLRRAQCEQGSPATAFRVGPQTVSNDPASTTAQGRYALYYNGGDAPTPVTTRLVMPASSAVTEVHTALRSNGRIPGTFAVSDYINNAHVRQVESGTLGDSTTAVTDVSLGVTGTASGSGSNVARTNYVTTPTLAKRATLVFTTGQNGLKGDYDIWVRVRTATAAKHNLQVRWAPANVSPATYSNAIVPLDTTNAGTQQWVDVNLGRMQIPTTGTLGGVSVELWSERVNGGSTDHLWWDVCCPVPADESVAYIRTPNTTYQSLLALQGGAAMAVIGNDPTFTSAPFIPSPSNVWRLSSLNSAVTVAPALGLPLQAGHHSMTFTFKPGARWTGSVICRVIDTGVAGAGANASMVSHAYSLVDASPKTLQFDTTATHLYAAQVYANSVGAGVADLVSVVDSFTPIVSSGEMIESDAKTYTLQKLDSSAQVAFPLILKGQLPFIAQPGLNIVYLRLGETAADGYDLQSSPLTRSPIVSFYGSSQFYA